MTTTSASHRLGLFSVARYVRYDSLSLAAAIFGPLTLASAEAELLEIIPEFEASLSYDDNRLLDPVISTPLERYSFRPSVDLVSRTDRVTWVATAAALHIETSNEAVEQSRTDFEGGLDVSGSLSPRLEGGLSIDVAQQSLLDDEVLEAGISPEDETLLRVETVANLQRTISERTVIAAQIERTDVSYTGQSLADYALTAGRAQLDHTFSERTEASLDAGLVVIDPEDTAGLPAQEQIELSFVGAGFRQMITEKLAVQGRLQPTYIDNGTTSSAELAPELQLEYTGREHTVSAGIRRAFKASGFGGLRQVDEVSASLTRSFGPQVDAGVSGSHLVSTIFGTDNETEATSFGASGTLKLTDHWDVSLQYRWRKQKTFIQTEAAGSNTYALALSYRPRLT